MRQAYGNVDATLRGQNVYLTANCYDIGTLKITDHSGGFLSYVSADFAAKRTRVRSVLGFEDPGVELTIGIDANTQSLVWQAAAGAFRGVRFTHTRYYAPLNQNSFTATTDYLILFDGIIIDCAPSTTKVVFTAGSAIALMQSRNIGRILQAGCPYVFNSPAVRASGSGLGAACNYQGSVTTCDHTRDGTNGCNAKANLANFGGFADAPPQSLQIPPTVGSYTKPPK
jgi:hypothetical protein